MKYNQIICGNSVEVLSSYEAKTVDLVVTDPPYLVNYRDRSGRSILNDDNAEGVLPVFGELYRVLKPDSYCISFYGWNAVAEFSSVWAEAGFRVVGQFVWPKPYISRRGYALYQHEAAFVLAKGRPEKPLDPISDVQPWEYSGNKRHPTEKAVSVIAPLIKSYSRPGDLVLDPFLGSGTTAVAAALNGRKYLGIELEKQYCEIAMKRLEGVECYRGLLAA